MQIGGPVQMDVLSAAVDAAVRAAGGVGKLAEKLEVGQSAVSNWRRTGIPLKRVPFVSRVTGIPPHVLRPDAFDAPAAGAA